jgi:hypothetical protein
MTPDEAEMLRLAKSKAQKLLEDLISQQADLDTNPPKISAENLALGRAAMQNAIASARRTVQALNDAEQIGLKENEDDDIGRLN